MGVTASITIDGVPATREQLGAMLAAAIISNSIIADAVREQIGAKKENRSVTLASSERFSEYI